VKAVPRADEADNQLSMPAPSVRDVSVAIFRFGAGVLQTSGRQPDRLWQLLSSKSWNFRSGLKTPSAETLIIFWNLFGGRHAIFEMGSGNHLGETQFILLNF